MPERPFEKNPIVEELRSSGGNIKAPIPAIYSLFASFAVALFGGVYGIVIFTALSLRRLGRFSAETPLLIVILYIWTAILFWSAHMSPGGPLVGVMGSRDIAANAVHYLGRALALVYLGFFFYRHRLRYKTMRFMGVKSPDGWWPAVLSIIAGTGVGLIVAWLAILTGAPS